MKTKRWEIIECKTRIDAISKLNVLEQGNYIIVGIDIVENPHFNSRTYIITYYYEEDVQNEKDKP